MGTAYSSLACPLCSDFSCKQEACFIDHLTDVHGVADPEACYVEHVLNGVMPVCACGPSCAARLRWGGWKQGYASRYARGHNARVDSVYKDPVRQAGFVAKRVAGYVSGRLKVWNDGLTKEADERVAAMAEKTSSTLVFRHAAGELTSWQAGLTKETDQRLARASATHRAGYATGKIVPWNKGLTKATSPTVAEAALKISDVRAIVRWGQLSPGQLSERLKSCAPAFELVTSPCDYRNKYQRLDVRCRACGAVSQKTLMMLMNTPVCFFCHPKESKGQLELLQLVRSLAHDAVSCDRAVIAPMELDVWVPSARLGIEYDGLYWHSELFVPDDHQARKLTAAKAAGVKLLRVFEDDWRDRRPIVEGMIRHRLGCAERRMGARECTLVELDTSERRAFFEANHLDGDVKAKRAWGLHDRAGELVAAMSLRKPFHAVHGSSMEVARFATANGVAVSGALSRLAKTCRIAAGTRVMTYVDGRVGDGAAYERAGFRRVKETAPRFWWTDFVHRRDRFSVRADAARGITQAQAAEAAGVVRIIGSPNVLLQLD